MSAFSHSVYRENEQTKYLKKCEQQTKTPTASNNVHTAYALKEKQINMMQKIINLRLNEDGFKRVTYKIMKNYQKMYMENKYYRVT